MHVKTMYPITNNIGSRRIHRLFDSNIVPVVITLFSLWYITYFGCIYNRYINDIVNHHHHFHFDCTMMAKFLPFVPSLDDIIQTPSNTNTMYHLRRSLINLDSDTTKYQGKSDNNDDVSLFLTPSSSSSSSSPSSSGNDISKDNKRKKTGKLYLIGIYLIIISSIVGIACIIILFLLHYCTVMPQKQQHHINSDDNENHIEQQQYNDQLGHLIVACYRYCCCVAGRWCCLCRSDTATARTSTSTITVEDLHDHIHHDDNDTSPCTATRMINTLPKDSGGSCRMDKDENDYSNTNVYYEKYLYKVNCNSYNCERNKNKIDAALTTTTIHNHVSTPRGGRIGRTSTFESKDKHTLEEHATITKTMKMIRQDNKGIRANEAEDVVTVTSATDDHIIMVDLHHHYNNNNNTSQDTTTMMEIMDDDDIDTIEEEYNTWYDISL